MFLHTALLQWPRKLPSYFARVHVSTHKHSVIPSLHLHKSSHVRRLLFVYSVFFSFGTGVFKINARVQVSRYVVARPPSPFTKLNMKELSANGCKIIAHSPTACASQNKVINIVIGDGGKRTNSSNGMCAFILKTPEWVLESIFKKIFRWNISCWVELQKLKNRAQDVCCISVAFCVKPWMQ